MDKRIKKDRRPWIQALSSLLANINLKGFLIGDIYKGPFKRICLPGLNCYSCPGAIGSCPIGSLQALTGAIGHKVSFYILGIMMAFGLFLGRFICGFLCPFGFYQDLIYKIRTKKYKVNKSLAKYLKYLKYFILVFFVILLPNLIKNPLGMGNPYFCKYVCPQGTLSGGLPLIAKNSYIRGALGFLFSWKLFLLILISLVSIFFYRSFCRFICPLGAFYGLFNKFSIYSFRIKSTCIECKSCQKACKFDIACYKEANSPECIRCKDCIRACPVDAIESRLTLGE